MSTEVTESKITVEILSVGQILANSNLRIPPYQRPYKWERRHIRELFYDVYEADEKNVKEYRIGSIILHENDNCLDIVDGQQRLISLSLYFLSHYQNNLEALYKGAVELINCPEYISISRKNAQNNFKEWDALNETLDPKKKESIKKFFTDKCKISVIKMPKEKLQEAFQLFDSQNNRGKPLDPHDLLKAYHLRAIEEPTESTVARWEQFVDNEDEDFKLAELFDKHLFRIRRWTNGETGLSPKLHGSELKFSDRFIDDFKGVNPETEKYRYLELYKMLKDKKINYPFSICMPIMDGESFFKYIEYSYDLFLKRKKYYLVNEEYTSNKYARNNNLYENISVSFIDKFGEDELKEEIKKILFIWSFYPRKSKKIYDATIANYAAGGKFLGEYGFQKLFQLLSVSPTPIQFISKINMDNLKKYSFDQFINDLNMGFE